MRLTIKRPGPWGVIIFSPRFFDSLPRLRRPVMNQPRALPECWGHRGASAAFPENTLASFEAAIRDGAEGIESDVHVSLDNVVVMFHDPDLQRTTDSIGKIKERRWYGEDGMEHVRTRKVPAQAIPTFAETVALLMKPENLHVKFNVDVKPQNDPERLFKLMNEIISSQPDWEVNLAPRILLGLWHPRFLSHAKALLPYCRRSHIGESLYLSRKYFWDDCEVFSVRFGVLTSADGQKWAPLPCTRRWCLICRQVQRRVQDGEQEDHGMDRKQPGAHDGGSQMGCSFDPYRCD